MSNDYIVPVGRDGIHAVDTGKWRTQTPVLNPNVCVGCGMCRMYCPVSAIAFDGRTYSIDLAYCKGCGICAEECPAGAITLRREES